MQLSIQINLKTKEGNMNLKFLIAVSLVLMLTACPDPDPPESAPEAPTNVTATAGPGYVEVSWQDNSDNEIGFVIYRRADASEGLGLQAKEKVGEVGVNATSFVDFSADLDSQYSYSVSALGSEGESAQSEAAETSKIETGIDLLVGTHNLSSVGLENGTIFVLYTVLPASELTPFEGMIRFDGPPSWNDGEALIYELEEDWLELFERGYARFTETFLEAVTGEYTATVTVAGQTYTAKASIADASYQYPQATNISFQRFEDDIVANWTNPTDAKTSFVEVWKSDFSERFAWAEVTVETHTFKDLELPAGEYVVGVASVPLDYSKIPTKIGTLGMSFNFSEPFTVAEVSSLCSSPDETVSIPDTNLLAAIREELEKPTGEISCLDMALLSELEQEDAGIADLTGLEYALNLESLHLAHNDISDLSPIKDLTQLEWLGLNKNKVEDLSPLASLTNLRGLYLSGSRNPYTDISTLANLTELEDLDIGGHNLGDIAVLAGLTKLQRVWTWGNELDNSDMSVFAGRDLELLNLDGNSVSDLSFLATFTTMQSLDVIGNGVSDISVLENMINLDEVFLSENQITDISALVNNAGIADGDEIELSENLLDLSEGSDDLANIEALQSRGVEVIYLPQQ